MAGRIRDEDVAAVREKASIADEVGEHVQLRNSGGGNLMGICPFHEEKSPSFSVSPARNLFHCFGCGAGGDVIGFVRELDGLTFSEAVERLAGQFNVTLTYEGGGQVAHRETGKRQRLVGAFR